MWNPILKTLTDLGWSYRAWEQDMLLRLGNGSWLQCLGVDDVSGIKRLQGDYSNLVIADEAHLPHDDIQGALFSAATPMLMDYGGQFDWIGLPPDIEPCVFSNAMDNPAWKQFSWDMFAHDYPESREKKRERVQADLDTRGMTWEHPYAQRTFLGKRARDPITTAYEYQKGRNDYDPGAVDFDRPGWSHSVGLDLGFQDRDAIVVLAWRYDDPDQRVFCRFAWQRNHLSTDALAEVVHAVAARYHPMVWTGDTGGHGAVKVLETLMERLRIQIQPKPPDVMVSLGFCNDDLRTGRLLLPTKDVETAKLADFAQRRLGTGAARVLGLLEQSGADVGQELARVVKVVNPRTLKVSINPKGATHSDVSEALRYAHAGAYNWLARSKPKHDDDAGNPRPATKRRSIRQRLAAWKW